MLDEDDIYDLEGRSNASIDYANAHGEAITVSDPESLAEALLYCHPDHEANCEKWMKFLDCYRSKDMARFLFRHTREAEPMYHNRIRRGYYYNYVASVVDLYVAFLYHSPISRQLGADKNKDGTADSKPAVYFEKLYKDADRRGTRYTVFVQLVETFAQIYGHCGVLVDMPRKPAAGFASKAEEEAADFRPHLTLVQAPQIKDWELDKDGNFEWVKIEIVRPQKRTWKSAVDEKVRNFVIWTKAGFEEWQVTEKEDENGETKQIAERVNQGNHTLGKVPLVIVRNERDLDHKWFGISAIRDISDINIAIYNWCSLQDEEIYERCLNILAMEVDATGQQKIELSQYNVLEYPAGSQPPSYLVPGSTPLDLIMKAIDNAKNEIYRLAKLSDTGFRSREATSGIAYAFEFNSTNQSLGAKAESAEQAEVEIHRLVTAWMGEEFQGSIVYPKEFGVEDFLVELQILAEARATLSSDTAIREIEKRVTAKMFAKEPQELRDLIHQEIESSQPKGLEGLVRDFDQLPEGMSSGGMSEQPGVRKPRSKQLATGDSQGSSTSDD